MTAGPDCGQRARLGAEGVVAGRSVDVGLSIADPAMSRCHLRVTTTSGGITVEDLGATNGVLVDGRWDFVGGGRTRMLVKGDATCLSIAAASILAKVTRDRIMRAGADSYPGFDFDRNKGYPCPRHKLALKGYGPTAIHRRTWAFMDGTPWGTRRPGPDDAPTLF